MTEFNWQLWWDGTYEWLYNWSDGDCDKAWQELTDEFGEGATDGFADWLAENKPVAWSVWAGLPNG